MPTNTSATNATLITALPYRVTVDPDSAAQELWWKYVATDDDVAVGLFAWADDAGNYRPKLQVWHGDDPSTIDTDTPLSSSEAQRKPCVLPVFSGETYYVRIRDANGTEPLGASLVFSALPNPSARARRGDYLILDDTGGDDDAENWFPATVVSPSTGVVTNMVRLPAGEQGDALPTGEILLYNWNSSIGDHVSLFAKDFSRITDLTIRAACVRAQGTQGVFYVLNELTNTVYAVSRTGDILDTWVPTGAFVGIAANADGTVLYYTATAAVSAPVKRWDLVNDVGLSDLPSSAVTGYGIARDLLVMADDTLLVFYGDGASSPTDYFARRYSADGTTILNTISFGSEAPGRVNVAPDRISFVTFDSHLGDAKSRFTHYDLAGNILSQFDQYQCNSGFFQFATPIANPPRFGHSFSCPMILIQQDEPLPVIHDESVPCCPEEPGSCECPPSVPVPGNDGSPSSQPIPSSTGPVLPPAVPIGPVDILSDPYWTALCAGGGEVPLVADPVDVESWVS